MFILGLAASHAGAQSWVPPGNSEEFRWHRIISVGPYSSLNTATGTLITTVPLARLDGPGDTVLDFSLVHTSGSSIGNTIGQVAKRWRHSYDEWVMGGGTNELQRNSPGGGLTLWYQPVFGGPYARRPGVRDDVVKYTNPIRYVVTHKDQTTAHYEFQRSQVYCLTKLIDTHNNTLNVAYEPAPPTSHGRVTTITDASGLRSITLAWDPGNQYRLSSVTLNMPGDSRTWNFVYGDPNNNLHLTEIQFPAPVAGGARPSLRFTYDTSGNITDLYDLNGNLWRYEYLSFLGSLRLWKVFDPYNNPGAKVLPTTFAYQTNVDGSFTQTCIITDELSRVTRHIYDTNDSDYVNLPIKKIKDPLVTGDAAAFETAYVWNYNDGTLTSRTDRRGKVWNYTWDTNNYGDMLSERNPLNQTTEWLYTTGHRVKRVKDHLGRRTLFEYNAQHDLIKQTVDPRTDPDDGGYSNPTGLQIITNYTYFANGNLWTVRMEGSAATTHDDYDSYGNARRLTNPLGKVWTATFDAYNNKLTATEPTPGGTTSYQYDRWNRLTKVTHPDTKFVTYTYDNMSNRTSVTDENSHVTYFDPDVMNRVWRIRQVLQSSTLTTTFGFDQVGNKTSVTNPRSKTTAYQYDERHYLKQITYPDNTTRKFHYDGNGNRDKRWDGNNNLTTYVYDDANRLTTIDYPAGQTDVTFTYYANGLRQNMTDGTGTYTWNYNTANLVSSFYQPIPNKTVTYTYDTQGRKKTVVLGGQTWTYNYNDADQATSIQATVGFPTPAQFTYYDHGLLYTKTLGNSTRTYYGYDQRHRTTSISHRKIVGQTEPEQELVEYQYDFAGNATWYRQTEPPTGRQWTTTCGYDWANRLTSEVRTNGAGTPTTYNFNNVYAYDGNGNRTSVTRNGVPSTYTVDNNDKLTAGDGFSLQYNNSNGNPTTITVPGLGNISLTYDFENRVTNITGAVTNSFLYNGDGLRVRKTDSSGTTAYVYDGTMVIGETSTSGTITAYYLPGIGFVKPATDTRAFHEENAHGSTLAVTDNVGVRQSRYLYDGYGVTYTVSQALWTPYQYGGKHGYYNDGDTGMLLLGHRYYLPKLGRFLTQDPLGHEAGLNLYEYADNNPLTYVDPDGLQVETVADVIGIGLSLWDLVKAPSWSKAGTLLVDIGGAVVPGIPSPSGVRAVGNVAARFFHRGGRQADNLFGGSRMVRRHHGGTGGGSGSSGLSREAQKGIRSLERRIAEHEKKLEEYIKNPDAFDNKGILRNAPDQTTRDRIIKGRIEKLRKEIQTFKDNLEKLRGGSS